LSFTFRFTFRAAFLSTFAALCFDPPALQRDSNCTIHRCSVLAKKRSLALGQLDGDDSDHGGCKRSNNQKPFQRLASKQNH